MRLFSDLLSRDDTVLIDGALGTELASRGVSTALPLWSAAALEAAPQVVGDIHRDYVRAGARIITANTFRTTTFTFQLAGHDEAGAREAARAATGQAVSLARKAAGGEALVAGSLAPVGDCYDPSAYPGDAIAEATYRQLAQWIAEAGADLLIVETQITLPELRLALEAASSTGLTVLVSCLVDRDTRLLDGTPLSTVVRAAEVGGARGILINCVTLPVARTGIEALARLTSLPIGVYANAGQSQPSREGRIEKLVSDREYLAAVDGWVAAGARMIGGCCGTTPRTIAAMARRLSALAKSKDKL